MDFKFEEVIINNVTMDIIVDSDGTKWYPFTKILKKALKKDLDANKYRNTKWEKYLRLWPVKEPTEFISELWYIEEKGLIKFLKTTRVDPYSKYTAKREMALHRTMEYFGLERQERDKTYTVVKPTKKEYSDWEMTCFKYDPDVKIGIVWKRCIKCERYFPFTETYFKKEQDEEHTDTCLECLGQIFVNKNIDIQRMKELGREDLIKYIVKEDAIGLYEQLEKKPYPEIVYFFYSKSNIIKVLEYIEQRRIQTGEGNFYLSKISEVTNIHANKLNHIIDNDYEIGVTRPLTRHSTRTLYEDLDENDKHVRDLMLQARGERRRAKKFRDTEYRKAKKRKENAEKRRHEIENIIDLCDKNAKKYKIPKEFLEILCPDAKIKYAFATPKGIHILVEGEPKKNQMIHMYKLPKPCNFFKNLEKKLEKGFKEYED